MVLLWVIYDDEKKHLVPRFSPGLVIEPLNRLTNFNEPDSFNKKFTIIGSALNPSASSKILFSPLYF